MVSNGERSTRVKDSVYDLSGVLYHAARGGQVYSEYVEDAEKEGGGELTDFFREVQSQDARRAEAPFDRR